MRGNIYVLWRFSTLLPLREKVADPGSIEPDRTDE
jgi:hypothetical protein